MRLNLRRGRNEHKRSETMVLIMSVIGGALLLYASYLDTAYVRKEIKAEREHYCEMVNLWIETKKDSGWPDFQNRYQRECTKTLK
ncbi:hypothetical protein vBAcoSR7M_42 [Alteromonas phage vB_AcoS-R7M]|uniref:Uncharacterized protein n=1 Tax=Alteromonas phage vB_AcoS-R7M TaxID=2729541 RepID=A0A6M3YR98_9CAUD|nr:hypothetical protein HWD34_gp42 [Alteromonas phage vB_AcoS-R7M]QJI53364.1 hypothetical protein vBAcoSR7M_42 [Alteromonas phage vB_AcoS-R7M]